MGIIERIQNDTAEAMKAKDVLLLSTLRLVSAAIKNAEIEQRTKGAVDSDQLAIAVIKRHVKQTADAMEDFKRGGRADLVQGAEAEIKILQSYLPAELSDEEIVQIVDGVFSANAGAATNAGKLIGEVMKQVAGRADGARVRSVVEARLSNK